MRELLADYMEWLMVRHLITAADHVTYRQVVQHYIEGRPDVGPETPEVVTLSTEPGAVLDFSLWLEMVGRMPEPKLNDDRSHDELVDEFLRERREKVQLITVPV
jgi:hypothetical protein